MKKVMILFMISLFTALVLVDYESRKSEFEIARADFKRSMEWRDLMIGEISEYFFAVGWYPDSLNQTGVMGDSIFINSTKSNGEFDIHLDPFSMQSYLYIPVVGVRSKKPEGYYLLSAGIDKSFNNGQFNSDLSLYDSLKFSYWDSIFGKKDILVAKQNIDDWISSEGVELSLKSIMHGFTNHQTNMAPRNIRFQGRVLSADLDSHQLTLTDIEDINIKAECYFAPSVNKLEVEVGELVQIHGIYAGASLSDNSILKFNNCIIIGKNE